jgi:hypothetical protein
LFTSGAIIYSYVNGNPVNAVDPTGLLVEADWTVWYAPLVFGTRVHEFVGENLRARNPSLVYNTSLGGSFGLGPNDGKQRADIVDRSNRQLWELKPLSQGAGFPYNAGVKQVNEYCASATEFDGVKWTPGNSTQLLGGATSLNLGYMKFWGGTWDITLYADSRPGSGMFYYSAQNVRSPGEAFAQQLQSALEANRNNHNFVPFLPGPGGIHVPW